MSKSVRIKKYRQEISRPFYFNAVTIALQQMFITLGTLENNTEALRGLFLIWGDCFLSRRQRCIIPKLTVSNGDPTHELCVYPTHDISPFLQQGWNKKNRIQNNCERGVTSLEKGTWGMRKGRFQKLTIKRYDPNYETHLTRLFLPYQTKITNLIQSLINRMIKRNLYIIFLHYIQLWQTHQIMYV